MVSAAVALLLAVASSSARSEEPAYNQLRKGPPVRLGDREIDVRYIDVDWHGVSPHGVLGDWEMLLKGENDLWLLRLGKHTLHKAVEADWKALKIGPRNVLGVSDDFTLGTVFWSTGGWGTTYRLGVVDFSKGSVLGTKVVDWMLECAEPWRFSRWTFDRKNKLAFALSCSHGHQFAFLDWGRQESIAVDLSRDGAKSDSVSWTGFEMKPGVYCFFVECLWWREAKELEDRKTWFRRVTLDLTQGVDFEVTNDPFEIADVIDVDEGMALCRLKDGRLAWVDYQAWRLVASSDKGVYAATSSFPAGGGAKRVLAARTSKHIYVYGAERGKSDGSQLTSNTITVWDLKTLKKIASVPLAEKNRTVWLGAFPQQGILAVIDESKGLQLFDIETLKEVNRGSRIGATGNAGTFGMSLTQSGRYGLVATPYAGVVTIFGLEDSFIRKIRTAPHSEPAPSGAFHIKNEDAEALLIITAPLPYE